MKYLKTYYIEPAFEELKPAGSLNVRIKDNKTPDILPIIKKIAVEFGYKAADISEESFINSGAWGMAFEIWGAKKVLKITGDLSEATMANRIRNKQYKNIISYYDVRKVTSKEIHNIYNGDGVYAIIMDSAEKVPFLWKRIINDIGVYMYKKKLLNGSSLFPIDEVEKWDVSNFKQISIDIFNAKYNKLPLSDNKNQKVSQELILKLINDIYNGAKELRKSGLQHFIDVKLDNMGVHKDRLVLLDIGGGEATRWDFNPRKFNKSINI